MGESESETQNKDGPSLFGALGQTENGITLFLSAEGESQWVLSKQAAI